MDQRVKSVSDTSDALLTVERLQVALPAGADRPFAVDDVSFTLGRGEILCIVGESGSGKSITAQAVMGLLPEPHVRVIGGRIECEGRDLTTLSKAEWRALRGNRMAMIFQEPMSALNPLMRVGVQIDEVLVAHTKLSREARESRVIALLTAVGLPEPERIRHAYPFRLSGGQRQRVMIAAALALDPALLIADEPTTALDVTTQKQILQLIRSIQREKRMGVLFITHDFGVVDEIADRVAVMQQGKLVEIGSVVEIFENPKHPYTRQLIAAVPRYRAGSGVNPGDAIVLSARNVTKRFFLAGGLFARKRVLEAVKDVDLVVRAGETVGLVGESGSGKSTFARCLVRLVNADQGEVTFAGHNLLALPSGEMRRLRPRIQMIFQDPYASLNPRRKVGRIIAEGPMAHGMSAAAAETKARELLALVGLDPSVADRFPHEFSGGQRQRVGLARALALDPEVLVADEPVSALDVSVQAQVLELLSDLRRRLNLAMVFITHDLRVAAQVCDTICVMRRGEIVERGPKADIFSHPQHAYTRELLQAVPGRDRFTTASV